MDSSGPLPFFGMILLIVLLVLLNGFFVAGEFAIVKARSSRLEMMSREGSVRARIAKSVVEHMNAYLSACQLGITLTSLGLGWIGEPAIAGLLEPLFQQAGMSEAAVHTGSFFLAFTLITALHITVGEQFPKTYAIRRAEGITLWIAIPLMLFYKLMLPFIWLLNGTSNWMLRKAGIEPESAGESVHTEEEIRVLVKESHNNGLLNKNEFMMVDNIFDFSERNAREIMIPRTEMMCLYAGLTFEENKQIAVNEMMTRYPVCDPDKDNIVGFIHIKDLLKADSGIRDVKSLMRPLTTVPESIPIDTLLRLMQRKKTQMVILIDEYGGTSGLVTVEDILEEIVGEIQDEFDEERPAIEMASNMDCSVDGLLLIDEINEHFRLNIQSEDYDTIGGWMYSQVEIPPRRHQTVRYESYEFEVEEVDHLRISRILIRMIEPDKGESETVA